MSPEPPLTIECPLRSGARKAPDRPALVGPSRSFSFSELDALVTSTAAELRARGLQGRRMALLLDNGWPTVALIMASFRAGVVSCPISTRLPAAAVNARLEQIDAAVAVTDRSGVQNAFRPEDLLRDNVEARGPVEEECDIPRDQAATIVFTSGSTGRPRAALHTFGNHYFSAVGSNGNIPLGAGDAWLLSLPLYHVGGLGILFRCLIGRAAVRLPSPDAPLARQVGDVTHVSMVATQLRRLLETSTRLDLRALLIGGSSIPESLIEEAHGRGLPIHTTYGLTEMASQVATTPQNASLAVLRTAGHVLPHREVRIAEDGEILVRGRTRFAGYVEGADTIRPFDDDGWFATGDLGQLDSEGLLHVHGRKDNMFISGGENILPEEIEAILTSIPGIRQATVVPVEDEEFGHRPVAFVHAASGTFNEEVLSDALAARLPKFMVPVQFHPWPQDEGEQGMKVDREALRRKAEERR